MLLLAGWNVQHKISVDSWSKTLRRHFWLPTFHKHNVPSREHDTNKSFDADQSQPENIYEM